MLISAVMPKINYSNRTANKNSIHAQINKKNVNFTSVNDYKENEFISVMNNVQRLSRTITDTSHKIKVNKDVDVSIENNGLGVSYKKDLRDGRKVNLYCSRFGLPSVYITKKTKIIEKNSILCDYIYEKSEIHPGLSIYDNSLTIREYRHGISDDYPVPLEPKTSEEDIEEAKELYYMALNEIFDINSMKSDV